MRVWSRAKEGREGERRRIRAGLGCEEDLLGVDKKVAKEACESSERGQGGPRRGQHENQGLGCAMRKVVSGPRGEVREGAMSAWSVGKEGRERDSTRIKA